jgi:hypothetical protein
MAWSDGIDRAANYIVTAVNWNALLGAAGSLMQLKNHTHGGTTGEGSTSLGPLVKSTFTDAAAPAAPAAGQTSLYTVSGQPRYRANGGADRQIITDQTTAAGDLLGTYPNPTVRKVTVGSDADGDMYYRASSTLARLPKGTAAQRLAMNSGATAPEWVSSALSTASNDLTGDVTMTNANQFYDGASVSLTVGTWFVVGVATLKFNGIGQGTARITDGSTHYASGGVVRDSTGGDNEYSITVAAIITLGGTTTIKMQAAQTAASGTMKAAMTSNGSGNNASHIRAIKV